jgi:hypothetical protein
VTPHDWAAILRHLQAQGFVVTAADPHTGRIVLTVPAVRRER